MNAGGHYGGPAGDGRRPDDDSRSRPTSAPLRRPPPLACDLLAELLAEPTAIERSRMAFAAARNNNGGAGGASPSAAAAAPAAAPAPPGPLSAPVSAPFAAAAPPPLLQGRRLPPSLALAAASRAEAARQSAADAAAAAAGGGPSAQPDAAAVLAAAFSALEASAAQSLLEGAEPPPGTLLVGLHAHQKVALAWMLARESGEKGGGGLLADEQGLGKTVEAAALIGSAPRGAAPPEDDDGGEEAASLPRGGTLVVCPNSLLHQWLAELRTKIDHRAFRRARSPPRDGESGEEGEEGSGGGGGGGGGDGDGERAELGGIIKHHGAERRGDPLGLSRADVVVTTYDTVRVDWRSPSRQQQGKKRRARSSGEGEGEEADGDGADGAGNAPRPPNPAAAGPLHSVRWSRIILDEAHSIRNASTGNARAVLALRSASRGGRGRWCLTGTPVVNGADDLFSLFAFLRHEPWSRREFFKERISDPMRLATGFAARAEAARTLRAALQAVTLRRTKVGLGLVSETPLVAEGEGGGGEREGGERGGGGGGGGSAAAAAAAASGSEEASTPLRAPKAQQQQQQHYQELQQQQQQQQQSAKLPPRTTIIQKVRLSKPERKLYDRLARGAASLFPRAAPSSSSASYVNMMERLLRLRQACDHPALVPEWRRLNIGGTGTETPLAASAAAAAAEPRAAATTEEEKAAASRLAPRVRAALLYTLRAQGQLCGRCLDAPERPASATPCGHLYCRTCALLAFPAPPKAARSPPAGAARSGPPAGDPDAAPRSRPCLVCGVPVPPGGAMTRAALLGGDATDEEEEEEEEEQGAKGGTGGGGAAAGNDGGGGEDETAEGDELSPPTSSFGSAKLDALMAIVLAVAERNRRAKREARTAGGRSGGARRGGSPGAPPRRSYVPEKVVVFSQWTSMLDLVGAALDSERVRFSRIDGSMNPAQRSAAVAAFQAEGDGQDEAEAGAGAGAGGADPAPVSVIVVSLKAASLGLNLTAASTVVLLDPWFNRATEQQAADRAHRLGQRTAEVRVVRLVAEDTVDERVVRLAEEKTRVAAAALGGERGMTVGAGVSGEELRFLITGRR